MNVDMLESAWSWDTTVPFVCSSHPCLRLGFGYPASKETVTDERIIYVQVSD